MLKLTKKADYGLMAMKHLAEHRDVCAQNVREIAEAYRIPVPLLAKVLQQLARAGLVRSQTGPSGGYLLARDADAISAYEVVRAIEGPHFMASCVTIQGKCEIADCCTIKVPLQKLNDNIRDLLMEMRISHLCEGPVPGRGAGPVQRVQEELVTLQ